MIVVIGEILIDRFPEYERVGGAPFNFAFHLRQLGFPVRFISRIGDDDDGQKIRRFMQQRGFPDKDLQVDHRHPTGKVEVVLDAQGIPQFNILEDVAYDAIELAPPTEVTRTPIDLIYYGTLAQRTTNGFNRIQAYLQQASPQTIRFCDINLRPPHVLAAAVSASLEHADVLKLNTDELTEVSRICNGPQGLDETIEWLQGDYSISSIAITRGDQGSSFYSAGEVYHSPPTRVPRIVDTVGAGDAYAAILAAGRLRNLPNPQIMQLATRFAADICALPGAAPQDDQLYNDVRSQIERIVHDD